MPVQTACWGVMGFTICVQIYIYIYIFVCVRARKCVCSWRHSQKTHCLGASLRRQKCGSSDRARLGSSGSWGMACSCCSDSTSLVDDPSLLVLGAGGWGPKLRLTEPAWAQKEADWNWRRRCAQAGMCPTQRQELFGVFHGVVARCYVETLIGWCGLPDQWFLF